ncbi:MAG: hypothetical protein H0W64_00040 [Gammaproteobacteria bacterium]|nr:hypothetical protein [Gammaproteobacteria bacterium]
MWLQRFTAYLLRHRWQAIGLTFISTFIPVIGVFGILLAAVVTLCRGIVEGALFTLAATVPYFLSFSLSTQAKTQFPLVVWAAIGVAVISNLLTWAFAVMLRRQASWRLILEMAALIGVLVVSIIHLAYPEIAQWWGTQLTAYYHQAQTIAGMAKGVAPSAEVQLEGINITKQYATGLIAAAILFNAILQLIIARWWQSKAFKAVNLRKELHQIRLSPLAGMLFLASFVLQYLGNSVILDIMPILYVLFGAAGLSFIHYVFGLGKSPISWFWLALIYVSIIFSLPMSMVMVSFLAMFDSWFDLRKRFKKVIK